MPKVTIQDYPVYDKYYYLVDFKNLLKVRLLPYYFLNKNAAKRAIRDNYPKKSHKYIEVLRGKKVKKFFLTYRMKEGLAGFTKYDYPLERLTSQQKKTYRTVIRRRLRRMGLLTLVKPKKSIKSKPDYIKPITNKQKVAQNKNSAAKVIQIERKPKQYYYLVLTKEMARKKKYLFSLECIKFDNNKGTMKKVKLHTRRTDVLIPFLITDLERLVYAKIQEVEGQDRAARIATYQKFGFRVHDLPSE